MNNDTPSNEAPATVGEAIDSIGGDSAVAKMLGVRPWAISKWRKRLPPNRVLWLSQKTGWKFTPHALAPDLYPNATDGIPPAGEFVIDAEDDTQPPVGGINKRSKLARANSKEAI